MINIAITAPGKLQIRKIPKPVIEKDDQVLLKIAAVGICGSDIHYFKTGGIGPQRLEYPFTLGHECTGVVEAVGANVTRVKPGDRVAVDPLVTCGKCPQCLGGRKHTCLDQQFLGSAGQLSGAMSEYLVMPEGCCFVLPDEIGLSEGVLIEPLSVGLYAIRLYGDANGKRVGVLGSGPIGLSVISGLEGAVEKLYVTDKLENRLRTAETCGADWTGNPDTQDIVRLVQKVEPYLLDAVFECCGKQEALDQAVKILKPGGTLVIVGIPEEDRISFPIHECRRNEIFIVNVRRQNECIELAIGHFIRKKGMIRPWLTHTFPPEKAQEVYDLVDVYGDDVIKAVIRMDGETA